VRQFSGAADAKEIRFSARYHRGGESRRPKLWPEERRGR
jgi:hypothetical protein